MDPASAARPANIEVRVEFLKQRGIGEVRAVLPPLVKILRGIVGRNEFVQQGQAVRLAKWKRAQQQRVDYAEDTCVCANSDGEGNDGESCVPGTSGPETKSVLEILSHGRDLRWKLRTTTAVGDSTTVGENALSLRLLQEPALSGPMSGGILARVPGQWYICGMRRLIPIVVAMLLSLAAAAQEKKTVSFPTEDGGIVYADIYGEGDRAVILAHGGQFNKESWEKQARTLVGAGFQVLALDFRGYGKSRGPGASDPEDAPLHFDVLAAVRYLRSTGAKSVSIVGGSMGGDAAGDASIASRPGEIDRIVFLGSAPNESADKLKSASLFIVARDDASGDGPRLPRIRKQYEKAPHPKELIILDGSAHAQFLFQTDQADRVMREILRFLLAK